MRKTEWMTQGGGWCFYPLGVNLLKLRYCLFERFTRSLAPSTPIVARRPRNEIRISTDNFRLDAIHLAVETSIVPSGESVRQPYWFSPKPAR